MQYWIFPGHVFILQPVQHIGTVAKTKPCILPTSLFCGFFYCVNCLMLQETGRVTMLPVNTCVGQATLGSRVNILVLLEHTDWTVLRSARATMVLIATMWQVSLGLVAVVVQSMWWWCYLGMVMFTDQSLQYAWTDFCNFLFPQGPTMLRKRWVVLLHGGCQIGAGA
jgi:hypothetical protein